MWITASVILSISVYIETKKCKNDPNTSSPHSARPHLLPLKAMSQVSTNEKCSVVTDRRAFYEDICKLENRNTF